MAVRSQWLSAWLALSFLGPALLAQEGYPLSVPTPKGSPAPGHHKYQVTARDDLKLQVHEWAPPKPAADNPVVVFIHGIGMHGEPYGSIASGFTSRGLVLVAPDLRGHGRSEGKREALSAPQVLRADLGAVIGEVNRRYPGAPVVLAGESMGGLLATDYAWRGERRVAGLALLAPAFAIKPPPLDPGDLLTPGFVSLVSDLRLKPSTSEESGFIKARRADGLALRKVSLTSYLAVLGMLQAEVALAAKEIKRPVLVCVAGKDQIVDSAATKRIFENMAAPERPKTWRQWDNAFHTLCWDPATPELIDVVAQWVLECGRDKPPQAKD
jgi:alpha-beta hydrolase superfamily lysophospholipase